MRYTMRLLTIFALVLTPAVYAQEQPDPTGHWKGAILTPARQFRFEMDLVRNEEGSISGTVALPDENLKGIPLKVALSGNSIQFQAREDQPFDGVLSADAKSIDGETSLEGNTLPFHMARIGEPVIEKPVTGAAIPAVAEGEWQGVIESSRGPVKVILILKSVAEGSVATLIDLGEGGLELPVVVRQLNPGLIFEITKDASWTGTINADGTEMTGSYREQDRTVTLNFRRAAYL